MWMKTSVDPDQLGVTLCNDTLSTLSKIKRGSKKFCLQLNFFFLVDEGREDPINNKS